MRYSSETLEQLIEEFARLPGVGRKSAYRMAMHILKLPREEVEQFSQTLINVKDRIRYCSVCSNFTEQDPCLICSSPKRDRSLICVVEESGDVLALEKTNEFRGLYHVLGGVLSPLDGIGPAELRTKELLARIDGKIEEVILALNPTVEGEATTAYLSRLLKPLQVKVSRIARGLPVGSNIEFADEATLVRALEGRVEVL